MNVYRFELSALKKSLFWWSFSIVCTVFAFGEGVYPFFQEGMAFIREMMEAMPEEFLHAFGLDISYMVGYRGFFGFANLYYALIGGIMATNVAIFVFGREKQNACQEFLFAKPVARGTVYVAKLMAVLTAIVAFNLCYGASSLYCFARYDTVDAQAVYATLALLLTQLVFAAIGILIASFKRRIRTVAELGSTVGFVAFVLSAMVNVLDVAWLKFFSPLHYFAPVDVFTLGGYDGALVCCALCVLAGSVAVTAKRYLHSDTMKL